MVDDGQLQKNRRKRVERLKKIIVTAYFSTILVLLAGVIALALRLYMVDDSLKEANQQQQTLSQQLEELKSQVENLTEDRSPQTDEEVGGEDGTVLESESSGQDVLSTDGIKRVYLTFDDGPSTNTAEILEILSEYQVKATFFVVGDTSAEGRALYQEILDEGHSLGIHSYSHKYEEIYSSEEAFFTDFYLLSDYLYDITGFRPDICRLPGGSSNTVSSIDMASIVDQLNEQGVTCYDWNISGGDAEGHDLTAEEIAKNVLTGVEQFQTSIVLLHDGKDKSATVEALRLILEELTTREELEILPITEETPIILHITH